MKFALFFLCIMSWVAVFGYPAGAQLPEVLVINSYHKEFPWVREHNGVLERGLRGRADVEFKYLDYKRISTNSSLELVESLKKSPGELPDVVVLTDDFAVQKLAQFFEEREVPVVFLGVNGDINNYVDDMHGITGVYERPLLKRSVAYLERIMGPGLKRCLLLMDDSMSSRVVLHESMHNSRSMKINGVYVDILLNKDVDDWKSAVLSAIDHGYDAVIIGTYHNFKYTNGTYADGNELLSWTSSHSKVPVFALWGFAVGEGRAIGGYVLSGVDQGREALKMVRRILDGEKVDDIGPLTGRQGKFVFSRPEMERWHITLPDEFNKQGYMVRYLREADRP